MSDTERVRAEIERQRNRTWVMRVGTIDALLDIAEAATELLGNMDELDRLCLGREMDKLDAALRALGVEVPA